MSANTKIEWADHTFNPWIGCTKVSPACDHCYAEADFDHRRHVVSWGPKQPRKRTAASTWAAPLRWNREAERLGIRYRVFCASLADVFDNAADREWRDDLATLILNTPNLDWQLLTKRIGNAGQMLGEMFLDGPPDNIWLGATIANQAEANRDIPKLLAVPAAKRFLSCEPLLGPVDLSQAMAGYMQDFAAMGSAYLDWVIVGGERGPNARPMHPDWARSLRDQCTAASVQFFFKQWGDWKPISEMQESEHQALYRSKRIAKEHENQDVLDELYGRTCVVKTDGIGFGGARGHDAFWVVDGKGGMQMFKVGKKAAGRMLDGREWNEVPA